MTETAQFSSSINYLSCGSTLEFANENQLADSYDEWSIVPNSPIDCETLLIQNLYGKEISNGLSKPNKYLKLLVQVDLFPTRRLLHDYTDSYWHEDWVLPIDLFFDFLKPRKPDPTKVRFSVATSSKGGIDIKIGSDTIHVRKYLSAHHPVVQMLFFARQLSLNTFEIAKSMVFQTIIDMFEKSSSSTSPKMYEAGWSPAKCRSKSHNAATPEDSTMGSNGRSSEASLPVLKPYYGNFSDRNKTVSAVDMSSMISEVGRDLTVLAPEKSLHEQTIMDNPGGSNGNTSILCSAHKNVQRQIRDTEPENHSDPDSGFGDHHDIEEEPKSVVTWLVASAAPHHATGNRGLLSDFTPEHGLFVEAGDGERMQVCGRGSVITDAVVLPNVLFVPGLTNNLVSASQLTELEYCLGFARGSCIIRRLTDNMIVGKASLGEDGLFQLDYLKFPLAI